jgi:NAD+ kinase
MLKFAISSKPKDYQELTKMLSDYNLVTPHSDPDFMIVTGGDGSILYAERMYPEIPKITFRKSSVGSMCMYELKDFQMVMDKVIDGKYEIVEYDKLQMKDFSSTSKTQIYDDEFVALNEIQLHNRLPTSAVRFSIYVNDEVLFNSIIGDGVIISTPFGSGGYYKSVGGLEFKYAIGIALNNPYNFGREHITIKPDSEIKIKVLRGSGLMVADNNPNFIYTGESNEFIIKRYKNKAKFVKVI